MKKTIHVVQEHIDNGVPGQITCCPLALAFQDQGYPDAWVGLSQASLGYSDEATAHPFERIVALPQKAIKFESDFDTDKPVKPFTFTVDVPDRKVYPWAQTLLLLAP